jgi:hypothetical protein
VRLPREHAGEAGAAVREEEVTADVRIAEIRLDQDDAMAVLGKAAGDAAGRLGGACSRGRGLGAGRSTGPGTDRRAGEGDDRERTGTGDGPGAGAVPDRPGPVEGERCGGGAENEAGEEADHDGGCRVAVRERAGAERLDGAEGDGTAARRGLERADGGAETRTRTVPDGLVTRTSWARAAASMGRRRSSITDWRTQALVAIGR